ncbi:class I SAM-dependent methyltransferase [Dyella sedimenti]|uniref:class I SAM-dependent methyltransferase n=1 Tax=Dyella sedimenti TaxID=2919947 RepID=UPI001FAABF1F|nr:class I SAM-dependent methyltransferase [Dyella sedimenti]
MLQRTISRIDLWRYRKVAQFCFGSVLDMGCGQQGLRNALSPSINYVGCDIDGGMVRGSAISLPFLDRTFDIVVLCEILEHLDAPGQAIREAARVAKNRIIISVPNDYSLVRLARLALGRDVEIDDEHIVSYNAFNLRSMLARSNFVTQKEFSFPLRLQLLPEIPIQSRFGYWQFSIADRRN